MKKLKKHKKFVKINSYTWIESDENTPNSEVIQNFALYLLGHRKSQIIKDNDKGL